MKQKIITLKSDQVLLLIELISEKIYLLENRDDDKSQDTQNEIEEYKKILEDL